MEELTTEDETRKRGIKLERKRKNKAFISEALFHFKLWKPHYKGSESTDKIRQQLANRDQSMKQQIKGLVKTLPAAKRFHCSRGVNDRVSVNCAFHYSLFGQFKGIVHPKIINVSFINPHVDKYNKISHFDSYSMPSEAIWLKFKSLFTENLAWKLWSPFTLIILKWGILVRLTPFLFYKRKNISWILKDMRVSTWWQDFHFLGTISLKLKLSLLKKRICYLKQRNKWLNKWQPTCGVDPSNPSFRMTVWIDFRRAW